MTKKIEEPEDLGEICECQHSESTHVEDESTSKWPCAIVDCVCDDFAVRDDSEPLLCSECAHEFDSHVNSDGDLADCEECECPEFKVGDEDADDDDTD